MSLRVDPGLAAIFGSEDRLRTLAALANSELPLTGYRVAEITEMKPPNVYRELKRLERVRVVQGSESPSGGTGWTLTDPLLRSYLRSRFRVSGSGELLAGAPDRKRRAEAAMKLNSRTPLDLTKFAPGRPPSTVEVRRRRQKDRVLARARARTSARGLA